MLWRVQIPRFHPLTARLRLLGLIMYLFSLPEVSTGTVALIYHVVVKVLPTQIDNISFNLNLILLLDNLDMFSLFQLIGV